MENLMSRYRNVTILVAILFVQVLGLAVQVKRRSGADESTRIIRLWTVSAVTPLEKAIVWAQNGLGISGATTFTCAECGRKIAI